MSTNTYEMRGVSSGKEDVHAAIKNVDKGIFPNAFCKILPDLFGGLPDKCSIIHADGAGTKTALAYLYWKETGDLSVWKGVIQDSIVMNLDDLSCVGAVNVPLILSGNIGRNKHLIPPEVVSVLINSAEEFSQKMRDFGIDIQLGGGETADVGDLVRTVIIDHTMACTMPRSQVVDINIKPDALIVGLASFGQAYYESEYNGGMGSNGLTGSRHDVFCKDYITQYPETFDPILLQKCPDLVYKGSYRVIDPIPEEYFLNHSYIAPENVGKLVLSPTRAYAPILKQILNTIERTLLQGIIHCSGGGQTKVLDKVNGVHIIKDNLFPIPPLFQLIGDESVTSRMEMYKTFNMGHRMELYVDNLQVAQHIINISKTFNVGAKIIGRVEACDGKKLTIKDDQGEYVY